MLIKMRHFTRLMCGIIWAQDTSTNREQKRVKWWVFCKLSESNNDNNLHNSGNHNIISSTRTRTKTSNSYIHIISIICPNNYINSSNFDKNILKNNNDYGKN